MGLRMDDMHAPTVASGPTSRPTAHASDKRQSLPELMAQKEDVEAELSALGAVLDSVSDTLENDPRTFPLMPTSSTART